MSNDYTILEITPKLRWFNGVLQQAYSVTHIKNGVRLKISIEWRDVPAEGMPPDEPLPVGKFRSDEGEIFEAHVYQPMNGVNDACRECGFGANVRWHKGE